MLHTPSNVITIAKICEYLSANDIDKKGLYGGGIDLSLSNKIYNIRKSLEWYYNKCIEDQYVFDSTFDPTFGNPVSNSNEETLYKVSNYLYALCAPYNLQAQLILGYIITESELYILTENSEKIKK